MWKTAVLTGASPGKLRRLQYMQRVKEMLIDGYSYSQIMQDLHISERQFYRWLNKLYEEDCKALEAPNNKAMLRAVNLYIERSAIIYRGLLKLAEDPNVNDETRRIAYYDMAQLTMSLVGLQSNTPLAAKKLREQLALVKTSSAVTSHISGNIYLPPAVTREQQEQYYQEQVREQQEQHQKQEREDQQQQQEQRRREWWVDPRSYGNNARDVRP